MKKTFPEYYPIEADTIDKVWNNGIFCYDANVLLNLYRYSNDTRNKIFENIEYFIGRTILPYQACYEYHKNRREVLSSLIGSYDKITKIITDLINTISTGELSTYRKHCALDIEKDIVKPFRTTATKVIERLKEKKTDHSSYLNDEEIHNRITSLFDNKISAQFTKDKLKQIYADGKNRYEKEVPPGFADYKAKKNRDENSLYGDLIIWNHLMAISKEKDRDIIFVTDDRKKDWWDIYQGQTKGPLPALYREFREMTNHKLLIYSVEDFMKYAPEHTRIAVSKKVISELEDLRKTDERRKKRSIDFTEHSILSSQDLDWDGFSTNILSSENYTKNFDEIRKAFHTLETIKSLKSYQKILEDTSPDFSWIEKLQRHIHLHNENDKKE